MCFLIGKGWFQLLPWLASLVKWCPRRLWHLWLGMPALPSDLTCQRQIKKYWQTNNSTTAMAKIPFKGRWEKEEFLFHRWKKVSSKRRKIFLSQWWWDHLFRLPCLPGPMTCIADKQQLLATLNKMATVPWDEFLGFHQGLKDENNHSNGCVTVSWSTHGKTGKYWAVGCVQVLNHLRSVGSDSWRQKVSQILPTSSHPSEQIRECHISIHVPPKLSYHSSLSTACAIETGNMKLRYLPL